MSYLSLKGVSKSYGTGASRTDVLDTIDLEVAEGEFLAIVGFSGSGKTTLISAIAGLAKPDSGEVRLKGRLIEGPGPDRGVVFQSYSLMPWLTAEKTSRWASMLPSRRRREQSGPRASSASSAWSASPMPRTAVRRSFPAACASVWRSQGRLRWTLTSCCSMSRSPRSTP